ncbi:hypothetical protein ACJX0J_020623, partial [Zea mays]
LSGMIFDDPVLASDSRLYTMLEGFKKGGGQGNETSTSLSPTTENLISKKKCVPFTEKLIKSLSLHKTVIIEEKDKITRKRTSEDIERATKGVPDRFI